MRGKAGNWFVTTVLYLRTQVPVCSLLLEIVDMVFGTVWSETSAV